MSDPASALGGATYDGFASVREIGPVGMITLRASCLDELDAAISAAVGTKRPAQRRIEIAGEAGCGWMSPDEYLLLMPYGAVGPALDRFAKALDGTHHLAADVSDARAVFRIEGPRAIDVLRKLTPVDLDRLEPGELRRSRAAQVPVAFWKQNDGFTLVCFRSMANYVMGLLTHSAMPGSEP